MGFFRRLKQSTRAAAADDLRANWSPEVAEQVAMLSLSDQARVVGMLVDATKAPSGLVRHYMIGDRQRRAWDDEYILRLAGFVTAVHGEPMRDGTIGYVLSAHRSDARTADSLALSLRLPRSLAGIPLAPIPADPLEIEELFGPVGSPIFVAAVRPMDPTARSRFLIQLMSVADADAARALVDGWRRWVLRDPNNQPPEVATIGAGGVLRACVGPRRSWFHVWPSTGASVMMTASTDMALAERVSQELLGRPGTTLPASR